MDPDDTACVVHTVDCAKRFLRARSFGRGVGARDRRGWERFYSTYDPIIRRFAMSCGAPAGELEDCVQDIWTQVIIALPRMRYDPARGRIESWLYCLVRGRVIDTVRRRTRIARREGADNSNVVASVDPAEPAHVAEFADDRVRAMMIVVELRRRVSPTNFRLFWLRSVEQRSVDQVASILGLTSRQVWFRHHRVRRKLTMLIQRFAPREE